jgi:hypothetical protein
MQYTNIHFIKFRKTINWFSYTKFLVKKINVKQNFKLWENYCLIILPINILKFENFRVLHQVIRRLSSGDLSLTGLTGGGDRSDPCGP